MRKVISATSSLSKDRKPATDMTRAKQDGWVSVTGQSGKTITVVDYPIANQP